MSKVERYNSLMNNHTYRDKSSYWQWYLTPIQWYLTVYTMPEP